MHYLETCALALAYLACVGVALEFSHKLYWRLSGHLACLQLPFPVLMLLAGAVTCVPLASALVVTAIFCIFISHQPISALGLLPYAGAASWAAQGAGVALGCVVVVFLIGLLAGHIRIRRYWFPRNTAKSVPGFVEGIMVFLTGSIFEELVFRGYLFALLLQYGPMAAIVPSSVIFSVVHLIKHRGLPKMFTVNALLFGLLAATCRYCTGGLWLPVGLHFGWNVVSGSILGLPYSGKTFERGVAECDVCGPVWLTGGLHSLDAGVLGTVALAIAAVGLLAVIPLH